MGRISMVRTVVSFKKNSISGLYWYCMVVCVAHLMFISVYNVPQQHKKSVGPTFYTNLSPLLQEGEGGGLFDG